jgi:hypothetical protein
MFTREYLLSSDWYKVRLKTKQEREKALWKRHVESLKSFTARPGYADEVKSLNINERLAKAEERYAFVRSKEYLERLVGTLGADPLGLKNKARKISRIPTDFWRFMTMGG